ncbi:hypothetical protein BO71DRAFT_448359 [Aspergillus ellipticus CBS 707.79]|uniref:Aminoglycoside phosphotransferase domain-containing protein n=1 Tax=Aspergillus ellipticus CBS 707.79 TaxID=1448320 RepID=A0A319DH44_9EURO|nr:hypothetical protein BO71DRAFT_448359 [Aspergillus ellipticus CBS 707.79]
MKFPTRYAPIDLKPSIPFRLNHHHPHHPLFIPQSLLLSHFSSTHPSPPHYRSITSTTTPQDPPEHSADLFHYTTGRWLWDEEQQLRDRATPFNASSLQKIAAQSVGAKTCTSIAKLAEGSFNKTFRLTMDTGLSVIARIPHPISGPRIQARTILRIPTPQVYAWNADVNNAVGSEYIIMEEAPGTQLEDVWDDLSLEQKIEVVKDLVQLENRLLHAPLNRYGSLYFASENIAGAVPAEVRGYVSIELKDRVRRRFVIGPVAHRKYWSKERAEMTLDRGPWNHPQEYILSPAHREKAWLQQHAVPKPDDDPPATQTSPASHISALENYIQVAPYLLPKDPTLVAPYIRHTDLHAANIFVHWQDVFSAPLILQARRAKLVEYNGEIVLNAPANFKDLDADEKSRIRGYIAKDIPLLDKALRCKHGRMRCDSIDFVGGTWDDEIIPLREALIRVERYWDNFGHEIPCPIHFTPEELRIHAEESAGWNEVQDFWDSVSGIVSRDGWNPHHLYEDAVAMFAELRGLGLGRMKGMEREVFERETRWAER